MKTVKKFFLYLLLFIVLYVIMNLLIYWLMSDTYKDLTNYKILTDSPEIAITECKSSYSKGYISGMVTNNTEELIQEIYVKADFYDKNDAYVGTDYKTINILNIDETNKFSFNYTYTNVDKIEISITDEKPEDAIHLTDKISDTVEKYFPFIGIITIIYLLP